MRLLNTSTLTLHEFIGMDIPPYAILSHRWENEEVTFQDMMDGKGPSKAGYFKIQRCCQRAKEDGWGYAWIDSCCIDKTTSSELSEAINSMFKWYEESRVCYAYLSDVPFFGRGWGPEQEQSFRRSKWFNRGWTLQELLAPERLLFFDRDWDEIGTKSSLRSVISSVTKIKDLNTYKRASVAQKMSWASRRKTTREEDQAYCLMGLFGVNMPLLYGEGSKSFMRLQLEILKTSDDESIFAWADGARNHMESGWGTYSGLLSDSIKFFAQSHDIVKRVWDSYRPPFSMTNKGLRLELLFPQSPKLSSSKKPISVPLNCGPEGIPSKVLVIDLMYHTAGKTLQAQTYQRVNIRELHLVTIQPIESRNERGFTREIVFVEQPSISPIIVSFPVVNFSISTMPSLSENGIRIIGRDGGELYALKTLIAPEMARKASFPLQSTSMGLFQGFKEFQVFKTIVDPNGITKLTGEPREAGDGAGISIPPAIPFNYEVGVVRFVAEDGEIFFLLLCVHAHGIQLGCLIFPREVNMRESIQQFSRASNEEIYPTPAQLVRFEKCSSDRMSRHLASGKSINMSISACGRAMEVVDLRIDRSGKLWWPDILPFLE